MNVLVYDMCGRGGGGGGGEGCVCSNMPELSDTLAV